MRKLLQWIFRRPIAWLAAKLSSAPHERDVFASLSGLLEKIRHGKSREGVIRGFNYQEDKYIIFSDQHKGNRSTVDDFREAEDDYLAALAYYHGRGFHFINLGDCEELWKFMPDQVMKYNGRCFAAEKKFQDAGRYYRVYGNHDLESARSPDTAGC